MGKMPKRMKFFVFGEAQLEDLRFISNLVDLECAFDPVGRRLVNLHVEEIRILGDRFLTVAVRTENFLSVVDLPVKRT